MSRISNEGERYRERTRSACCVDCLGRIDIEDSALNGSHLISQGVDRNARAITGLRIAVGILFLFFGEYKVFGTRFVFGGGFEIWINRFLADHAAYPFMVPVLRDFVLVHATPIALLVAYGELAIGLSLTFGLWTRAASACGFIYMLALMFASNYPGPDVVPWQYLGAALDHLVLVFCFAALAIGDPDRSISVRAYVERRRAEPVSDDTDTHVLRRMRDKG